MLLQQSHASDAAVQQPDLLEVEEEDLKQAACVLNSLRPEGYSDKAVDLIRSEPAPPASQPVWRPQSFLRCGHVKSQRQSAAGALVAKAAGRSKVHRDGRHTVTHHMDSTAANNVVSGGTLACPAQVC